VYHHQSHGWTWYFWYKDAALYSSIAYSWYAPQPHTSGAPVSAAFFPLFPALIRLCVYLALWHKAWAGLIAAVLSGGASAVGVWALASRVAGRRTADRAVLLYCLFPGAMMFASLYSESLGIALTAATLLAAVNRKWLLAGLAALLATAEHSTLIVLAPALGACALHAVWTRRDWRSLIAPALAPLGMAGYFAWIGTRYHDYLFWYQLEHHYWRQKIDFGKSVLKRLTFHWTGSWGANHGDYVLMLDIMFWIMLAGIALMLAARLPLPVSLYTVLLFISLVIDTGGGPRPRFAWTGIGIFIGAAIKLPRWLYWPVLAAFAAGLCFLVFWWPYHPETNP
jgi:Gpi18-like mannosyltransferase